MTNQPGIPGTDSITRSLAIDGPTAVGKSVVGKGLSKNLSLYFCDTGLMYRAATLAVLESKISLTDQTSIINCVQAAGIDLRWESPEEPLVYLVERDVSELLRDPIIDKSVSSVAGIQSVRDVLVARQKSIASRAPVVMVGRDIGKVILPEARAKIFLDASLDERANRRRDEQQAAGIDVTFEDVRRSIAARDDADDTGHRSINREQAAAGATVVDTDGISQDQVIERCAAIYRISNEF